MIRLLSRQTIATSMKINFSGSVEIEDGADDRGTVDNWLVCTIKEIIDKGPELDEIYEGLSLSWEVDGKV